MDTKLCVLAGLSLASLACNHNAPRPSATSVPGPDKLAPRPAVHSIAETAAVTALAVHGRFLYTGTPRGVVRFGLGERDEGYVRLTKDEGLSGNRVSAMTASPSGGLWVATEGGISRFLKGVWTNVPLSEPMAVGCMTATRDHLWAGGDNGLARLDRSAGGKWTSYLPGVRVTQLMADLSLKGIWAGTDGEGIFYGVGGKFEAHDPSRGQVLRKVRGVTLTLDGGVLAVGETAAGQTRLVFYDGRHWTTYTPTPAAKLRWVSLVQRQVLLAHGDRILVLRRADLSLRGPRRLPVGPVKLSAARSRLAPRDYPLPYFYTKELKMWLPPEPTVVVGQGDNVLIGTSSLGAVVYDGKTPRWYRTTELLGADVGKLKLGCGVGGCFLAGGGGKPYRYDRGQRRFVPVSVDPDSTIYTHAFTAASGMVVALTSPADRGALTVRRLQGKTWVKLQSHPVRTPGSALSVRFARYSPSGELWVGLTYLGADDERRPWGVMVLSSAGRAIYHRSSLLPTEDRPAGSLALPDDIRDVHFHGGETWLATSSGLCRVRGSKVDLVTENEGLESELTYAVATRPGGELLVASYGGVGRFDGKHWRFDLGEDLEVSSRALAVVGKTLWAGTSRGLVKVVDGDHQRIGPEQGLAGVEVRDIVVARGKLWVLTDGGVSLLEL